MDATTEKLLVRENYLAVEGARRAPLVDFYLGRLRHLLQVEAEAAGATHGDEEELLSAEEVRQLRTTALLSTVRTLTAMDEGPAASQLLRRASRR